MYFSQTFQFANMRLQLSEKSALLLLDAFYVFLLILLSPWWLLMLATKPAFRAGFAARFALRHASKSGIPTYVLNGRMSQKSFQAHRRTQLIPWALRKVSLLAVQSEEDAARFRDLGVANSRITITGNMKYDLQDRTGSQDWQQVRRTLREHHGIDQDMPVLIGGSIHLGEDQALAWASSDSWFAETPVPC
jgi:hypothetical protein